MTFRHLISSIRVFILAGVLALGGIANAQEGSSAANQVFAEAVQLYRDSQSQDEAARKAVAVEILRMFDLIVTAYPESVPGKRISSGKISGLIDIEALRKLAGQEDKPADVAVEQPQVIPPADETKPVVWPKWYQRAVPTAIEGGGFGHGEFPSIGQRTHAGLDLISACGDTVKAPWEGQVEQVIKAGDTNYPKTGNAVILRHDEWWNPAVYTAYLDLGATSLVSGGKIKKGQAIGKTGPLHGTDKCGVHLEVRNFGTELGPIYPLWHNVLGVGNWSKDADFKENWRDPEAWLRLLSAIESGKLLPPELLAQKDWIRIYRPGALGQFDTAARDCQLSNDHQAQGLLFAGCIRVKRQGNGIEISAKEISSAARNARATVSRVKAGEEISFSLRATVYAQDRPDIPIFQRSTASVFRYRNRKFEQPRQDARVFVPWDEFTKGDFIRLEFVAKDGRSFLLGKDNVGAKSSIHPLDRALATQLALVLGKCINWREPVDGSITLALSVTKDRQLMIEGSGLVDYNEGTSWNLANRLSGRIRNQIKDCKGFRFTSDTSLKADWIPLELVLGGTR